MIEQIWMTTAGHVLQKRQRHQPPILNTSDWDLGMGPEADSAGMWGALKDVKIHAGRDRRPVNQGKRREVDHVPPR